MKINLVKKSDNTFCLAYDSDYENSKKIPVNEIITVEYKKVRNIKFHRKFFALLNLVYENQETYLNIEDLRRDLTIYAGYYRNVITLTGEQKKEPLSISFAQMEEIEFQTYYSKVLDVIVKWLEITKETIEQEIINFY